MTGVTCKPRRFNVHKELDASFGPFHGKNAENIHLRFWGQPQLLRMRRQT
jgi:hypothetical protein